MTNYHYKEFLITKYLVRLLLFLDKLYRCVVLCTNILSNLFLSAGCVSHKVEMKNWGESVCAFNLRNPRPCGQLCILIALARFLTEMEQLFTLDTAAGWKEYGKIDNPAHFYYDGLWLGWILTWMNLY